MGGCQETRTLIAGVVDGQGGAELQARVEAHVLECAGCRAMLESQREVRHWLASRADAPVPPGFGQRLQRRLHDDGAERREEGWVGLADWRRWTQLALPVAAGLLVAVLLTGSPTSSTSPTSESSTDASSAVPTVEALLSESETGTTSWWGSDVSGDDLLAAMLGTASATKGTANGQ